MLRHLPPRDRSANEAEIARSREEMDNVNISVRHSFLSRIRLTLYTLQNFKTRDAVENILEDMMCMATVSDRADPYLVRGLIPFALLRLNKDQQCYDFVKWYATKYETWLRSGAHDDLDNQIHLNNGTFLTITDANVFEDVEYFDNIKDLNLLVAAMLDESTVINHVPKRERDYPVAIRRSIPSDHIYHSSILANGPSLMRAPYNVEISETAPEQQVHHLFDLVQRTNKHFWKILLNPEGHLNYDVDVQEHKEGSLMEARATLQKCFDAWSETEGAFDWVKEKVETKE
ncbi:hypothetical protein HDV00_007732 [Rhizophlyctis rosea]|nr:hypothetical protein HDV00_007732 [Rhizophlyctis rosea]